MREAILTSKHSILLKMVWQQTSAFVGMHYIIVGGYWNYFGKYPGA